MAKYEGTPWLALVNGKHIGTHEVRFDGAETVPLGPVYFVGGIEATVNRCEGDVLTLDRKVTLPDNAGIWIRKDRQC